MLWSRAGLKHRPTAIPSVSACRLHFSTRRLAVPPVPDAGRHPDPLPLCAATGHPAGSQPRGGSTPGPHRTAQPPPPGAPRTPVQHEHGCPSGAVAFAVVPALHDHGLGLDLTSGLERHPVQVRPDWGAAKLGVMRSALSAKFQQHEGPRAMLLATATGEHGPQQVGPRALLVVRMRAEALLTLRQQRAHLIGGTHAAPATHTLNLRHTPLTNQLKSILSSCS